MILSKDSPKGGRLNTQKKRKEKIEINTDKIIEESLKEEEGNDLEEKDNKENKSGKDTVEFFIPLK